MKKKTQKIIICISLVIMLFVNFGNVLGATNESYSANTKVYESALDAKIQDSILLDALANMINALASLVESLIGGVFSVLTGDNIFPWADRIIFNAIPFLDINFLNPDPSSLFGSSSDPSILGKVVQQVYSTIFSLAVLFLGVAVGIMAIRLAISSIAAEKAKYKQAIVNWATCIVMLFLMHYILAFVFWINEQMVEIASNVLLTTIKEEEIDSVSFDEALTSVLNSEDRVKNFLNAAAGYPEESKKVLEENPDIASNLIRNSNYIDLRMSDQALEDDGSGDFNFGKWISYLDDNMGKVTVPTLACDTLQGKAILELKESDPDTFKKMQDDGCYKLTISQQIDSRTPEEAGYKYINVYTKPEAIKKDKTQYVILLELNMLANLGLMYPSHTISKTIWSELSANSIKKIPLSLNLNGFNERLTEIKEKYGYSGDSIESAWFFYTEQRI